MVLDTSCQMPTVGAAPGRSETVPRAAAISNRQQGKTLARLTQRFTHDQIEKGVAASVVGEIADADILSHGEIARLIPRARWRGGSPPASGSRPRKPTLSGDSYASPRKPSAFSVTMTSRTNGCACLTPPLRTAFRLNSLGRMPAHGKRRRFLPGLPTVTTPDGDRLASLPAGIR